MKTTLCFILLLLVSSFSFADETIQKKVQNVLNDRTVNDPYERWKTANRIISEHLQLEESLQLYVDILFPFVEQKVKDTRKRNIIKAQMYSNIFDIHLKTGYTEELYEGFYKEAVSFANYTQNDTVRANIYIQYAGFLSFTGNIPLSHEYHYMAIAINEKLNNYQSIFQSFCGIAENLLVIRDTNGLGIIVAQMQQYLQKPTFDGNLRCFYDFYFNQSAYYYLLQEDYPEINSYKNKLLEAMRNTIHTAEKLLEIDPSILIGYIYYNMALTYSKIHPEMYETINYYLEKALAAKTGYDIYDIEIEICVYILYAELFFEQKRYKEAERDMLYALSLLEQTQNDNSLPEFAEVYKFLVMYYETMNRPQEALKYLKLLLENESNRYEKTKIDAINEMLVKFETEKKIEHIEMLAKFETEKKIEHIERLTEQNKTARKILILTISLVVVLIIVILTITHLYRLRKKNLELSIYETALLAELKQTELEEQLNEKEQLQKQYDKLKTLSEQNLQKKQMYDAELKQIKQQLQQKATKTMIEKLTDLVSKSYIEKTKKTEYIQNFSELDIDMMELGYSSAEEKISNMDMKYIACFAIDMDSKDMSAIFNVEPTTIRTVRYRIKKKFGDKNTFKFLM